MQTQDTTALVRDLQALRQQAERRRALGWLLAVGALAAPGVSAAAAACTRLPEETAGPFPGHAALGLSGILRSDIRASFAGAAGVARGLPLEVQLQLVDVDRNCAPLAGCALYLWHCDREGRYSMYSSGLKEENYLRGVQVSDAQGRVRFATVFPGCYGGRMPHMHFEVFHDAQTARSGGAPLITSQLAFPPQRCDEVYAASRDYATSARNLADTSFATDGVFSDGVAGQLAALSGDARRGQVATLTVGLSLRPDASAAIHAIRS